MINKEEILKKIIKKEDKILISNVIDKYIKYQKNNINTYTNFLDIREYNLIISILNKNKIIYNTYKACYECEKAIIYFGSYDNFVTIYKIDIKGIEHKDVLGTLFSLGYSFDTIGDIFIEDNFFYITNLTRLNSFFETNLYIIKNKRVELQIVDKIILNRERFTTIKIVIPSYRLDVIVSKIAHISRNDTLIYLKDKQVLVNYEEVTNPSKILNNNDLISIRKVGKFIVSNEITKSRKDNIFLEIKKYI